MRILLKLSEYIFNKGIEAGNKKSMDFALFLQKDKSNFITSALGNTIKQGNISKASIIINSYKHLIKDQFLENELLFYIVKNKPEIVKMLLDCEVDVESSYNIFGQKPLKIATDNNLEQITELLIRYGATNENALESNDLFQIVSSTIFSESLNKEKTSNIYVSLTRAGSGFNYR